jgi:hypothetical protein
VFWDATTTLAIAGAAASAAKPAGGARRRRQRCAMRASGRARPHRLRGCRARRAAGGGTRGARAAPTASSRGWPAGPAEGSSLEQGSLSQPARPQAAGRLARADRAPSRHATRARAPRGPARQRTGDQAAQHDSAGGLLDRLSAHGNSHAARRHGLLHLRRRRAPRERISGRSRLPAAHHISSQRVSLRPRTCTDTGHSACIMEDAIVTRWVLARLLA